VTCGQRTIVGTGHTKDGSHPLHGISEVMVDGELGLCAQALEKLWERPVIVPESLRAKRIKRKVKGTREEIADALGLRLAED
jgi:hypothetical protein